MHLWEAEDYAENEDDKREHLAGSHAPANGNADVAAENRAAKTNSGGDASQSIETS